MWNKCEENDQRVLLIKENRKGTVKGQAPFPSGKKFIIKLDGDNGIRHRLASEIKFIEE